MIGGLNLKLSARQQTEIDRSSDNRKDLRKLLGI